MSDADDLRRLADNPFTGPVSEAVVLTPDFARRLAARLASSAVETDPWGEHRYHGIASDPDGIIRCQKDGFAIDPNAELSRQVITAVETTATPDLLRAELRKMADTIRYREEEDGSWSVELMELPGHVGAGDTLEEAVVMALDAAAALATIPPTAPSGSPPVGLDEWTCDWCGNPLVPRDGVWTDEANRSGDYCPEGLAVGPTGTSPHLPRLSAPADRSEP